MADAPKQPMSKTPYEIVLVEDGFITNAARKLVEVRVIHYKTAYGDVGTIKIPVDDYTGEIGRMLVEHEVIELDKLRGM